MAQVIDSSVTIKLTIDEAEFLARMLGKVSKHQVEEVMGLDGVMHDHLFRFFDDAGFARDGGH